MASVVNFQAAVSSAMAPIIREYGYRVVESDDSYVRLDSCNVSIQVLYDHHRSFEVGVIFSENENGIVMRRVPFTLGEVYRECGVPQISEKSFFQSTDLEKVFGFLTTTCGLLLDYCRPILSGNRDAYTALSKQRSSEAASYTQQIRIEAVRKQAEKAWRNKRYEEFVDLLGKFKDGLSVAERKKFDYASKKVVGQ